MKTYEAEVKQTTTRKVRVKAPNATLAKAILETGEGKTKEVGTEEFIVGDVTEIVAPPKKKAEGEPEQKKERGRPRGQRVQPVI